MVFDVEDDINSRGAAMKLQKKIAVTSLDDYLNIDKNLNENVVVLFGKTDSGVVEIVPQIRTLYFLDFLLEILRAGYKIKRHMFRTHIQYNGKRYNKKEKLRFVILNNVPIKFRHSIYRLVIKYV